MSDRHCTQCAVKDESGRLHLPGVATGRLDPPQFWDTRDTQALRTPVSAEDREPTGQAALWFRDVEHYVSPTAQGTAHAVARQLARLCGDDSQVTGVTWRSLAAAVCRSDSAGRQVAFTERGVQALEEAGWLEHETIGQKRGARTTWRLTVGPAVLELCPEEEGRFEAA